MGAEIVLLVRNRGAGDTGPEQLQSENEPYILTKDGEAYAVDNPNLYLGGLWHVLKQGVDPNDLDKLDKLHHDFATKMNNGEYERRRLQTIADCKKVKVVVDFGEGRYGARGKIGDGTASATDILAVELGRTPERPRGDSCKAYYAAEVKKDGHLKPVFPQQLVSVDSVRGG